MQSYELLKFELQNCMNNKVERKGQKLDCRSRIWIGGPNTTLGSRLKTKHILYIFAKKNKRK